MVVHAHLGLLWGKFLSLYTEVTQAFWAGSSEASACALSISCTLVMVLLCSFILWEMGKSLLLFICSVQLSCAYSGVEIYHLLLVLIFLCNFLQHLLLCQNLWVDCRLGQNKDLFVVYLRMMVCVATRLEF